ncbi:hypothetical protein R1flu_016513 [Riccia fluitans]|uniref:Uncharacterized protein n=1 Tax=Riccia fluitans TaxID=41844 RepID=A0ABD1YQ47_9MARC
MAPKKAPSRPSRPRSTPRNPSAAQGSAWRRVTRGWRRSSPELESQTATDGTSTPDQGGPSASPRSPPDSARFRTWSPSFLNCLSGPGDVVEDNQRTFADLRPDIESPGHPLPEQAYDTDINPADIFRDIPEKEERPPRITVSGDGAPPRGGGDRASASPGRPSSTRGGSRAIRSPVPVENRASPAKSNPRSTGTHDSTYFTPRSSRREGGQDTGSQGPSDGSRRHQASSQDKQVSAGRSGGSPSGHGSPSHRNTPSSARGGGNGGQGGNRGGDGGGGGGSGGSEGPRDEGGDRDDEEEVDEPETYQRAESQLRERQDFELVQFLEEKATGLGPDALEDHYLRLMLPSSRRAMKLTATQTQIVGQRFDRLHRPVFDPNHKLVNYGHRRWPIEEDTTQYIDDMMENLWPRQALGDRPWRNDHAFMARLRQLIHEFNTFGLPRTIHLQLDHEGENTAPASVINPSYRCDCWIDILGEGWYNETDASLLEKLGPDWLNDGHSLLRHLLKRLVTGMQQSYIKDNFPLFKKANNYTAKSLPQVPAWPDDVLAILQKFLETRGFKLRSQTFNDQLSSANHQLAGELCGISKEQIQTKIKTARNYDKKIIPGEPSRKPRVGPEPRRRKHAPLKQDELIYLEKYLLRRKLNDPKFYTENIPQSFFQEFHQEGCSRLRSRLKEGDEEMARMIKEHADNFLQEAANPENRRGFRLRSQAIAFYNLLGKHLGLQTYNMDDGGLNDQHLVELALDYCNKMMDKKFEQLDKEEISLSDYDAQEMAAVLEAYNSRLNMADRLADVNLAARQDDLTRQETAPTAQASGGRAKRKAVQRARQDRAATGSEAEADRETQDRNNFIRTNYGPGSPQERIQPILLERALGPDRHLTTPEVIRILERPVERPPTVPPPPNLAFPDVYDQVYYESLRPGKQPRIVIPIRLPLLPSQRPAQPNTGGGESPSSPKGGGSPPSSSPRGGGGRGGGSPQHPSPNREDDGPPNSPPYPDGGGGGPLGDAFAELFNSYVHDVERNFPDMIELVKCPTQYRVRLLLTTVRNDFPSTERYFRLPPVWRE